MTVFVIVWPVWQDIDTPLCSAYMCGMANAYDTLGDSIVTAIRSGPCSILGLLANLTFSCGAFASYTNSGDSLLVFFWLSINPRFALVLRGWCKGWKIVHQTRRYQKGKANNQIQNNLSNLSNPMIQHGSERFKLTRPVSEFGQYIRLFF
jgi:hypothetical protein